MRAVAVEDVIVGLDRRLVGGAAGEQIAVAGLGVEQAEQLLERGLRGQLRRCWPVPPVPCRLAAIAAFTVIADGRPCGRARSAPGRRG